MLRPSNCCLLKHGGFLKQPLVIIHFRFGFSLINHPYNGVPPFQETTTSMGDLSWAPFKTCRQTTRDFVEFIHKVERTTRLETFYKLRANSCSHLSFAQTKNISKLSSLNYLKAKSKTCFGSASHKRAKRAKSQRKPFTLQLAISLILNKLSAHKFQLWLRVAGERKGKNISNWDVMKVWSSKAMNATQLGFEI